MSKKLIQLKTGIFGFGGHAREVSNYLTHSAREEVCFFVDPQHLVENAENLKSIEAFESTKYSLTIAIGNSKTREQIVERLPRNIIFRTIVSVHSNCPENLERANVSLGEGAMIAAGVTLTCHLKIGKHALLNTGCSIHHDSVIGDFFSAAPGARVLGNCRLGSSVTLGSNAVCLENITVCSDTVIGAGAVVTKDIIEPGVYVGVPARKREQP